MTTMPVAERMTANEYLARGVEDGRSELIDGVIVVDEPKPLHQAVLLDLHLALADWTRAAPGRGRTWLPLDIVIDTYSVYAPDLLWYADGRGPGRENKRPSPTPDLAVEVRSPSTWRYNLGAKKAGYEAVGVAELWLVDTSRDEVLIARRCAPDAPVFDIDVKLCRGETLTSPALPGFALTLDALLHWKDG